MKKVFAGIDKVIGWITRIFMILAMIAVALIALTSTVDSIGRYIFGSALRGASEYVQVAMAVFVYGGLCMAIRERKCVIVPVVLEHMKPRARLFVTAIGNLLCCAASVLLATQVFQSTAKNLANLHSATEVVRIPYGPFYLFCFIAICLFTVEFLLLVIKDLYEGICYKRIHANDPTGEDAAQLPESEVELS